MVAQNKTTPSEETARTDETTLSDQDLAAVSGGAKTQVTLEQWEKIVAQQIKNGTTKGGGASGSW